MKGVRVLAVVVGLVATGCTHTLEVKNLDRYRMALAGPGVTLSRRPTVAVRDTTRDVASQQIVNAVAAELQKYADVSLRTGGPTEFTAAITVQPQYRGRGHNFWINWPGFLVWAPAWHGYIYEVNWDMDLTLTAAGRAEPLEEFAIPVFLDVRHASFNRTWTEIGWIEYGVIPLVGGLFFMRYDGNVTPLLVEKVHEPIGAYVAAEIVRRLAAHLTAAAVPAMGGDAARPPN